jgi:peptide/nickel transport system substrate-binding protein
MADHARKSSDMISLALAATSFNRRTVLAAGLGAMALGLVAPRGGSAQDEPKQLVVAFADDIITNDPERAFEFYSWLLVANAYETLVGNTPDDLATPQPRLAKSWDVSDDGLTYTFHLDPEATFASGNPVTAEDVKFSHERLKNLKDAPGYYADPWVENITVIDPHTVSFTLNRPISYLLPLLTVMPLVIADSKLITEQGGSSAADADQVDTATEWLNQNSAGSGPYMLKSWTPKSEMVLEKNPNYGGEAPYFDRVIMKSISDPTAQIQLVLSGEADLALDIDYDAADQFREDPNVQIIEQPTIDIVFLGLNNSPDIVPELADRRVRQAIQHAIDYDGILNGLMRGHGVRPPSPIVLGVLGADESLAVQRDLDKARALLAEAGVDGFTFELAYPTKPYGSVDPAVLAAKIQADLAEIGITVILNPVESGVFSTEYKTGDMPAVIAQRGPDWPDPSGWAEVFGLPGEEGGFYAPRFHYDNPELQALITEASTTLDVDTRIELYGEIQRMFIDDATYVPLIQPTRVFAASPDMQGVEFHPIDITRFAPMSRA